MRPDVAVAVSGGVDSLAAACLLKKNGCKIVAIHFLTGFEPVEGSQNDADPQTVAEKIGAVCKQIDIPLTILDLSSEFQTRVVDYFIHAYGRGITPNPCLVCNAAIKFGPLLEKALQMNAGALATGHYARLQKSTEGRIRLLRGIDADKEQSYFLAFLSARQLSYACFPLGEMTKIQARRLVLQAGLQPAARQESQDVCFIRGQKYAEFLSTNLLRENRTGPIVDVSGRILGRHDGLHHFTVGQRRGINCPAPEPYYVLRIDPAQNTLVVGFRRYLRTTHCRVRAANWIAPLPETGEKVWTRIRYRSPAAAGHFVEVDRDSAVVAFDSPQDAVTPGQGAVFYRGEEVLGGGFIEADGD